MFSVLWSSFVLSPTSGKMVLSAWCTARWGWAAQHPRWLPMPWRNTAGTWTGLTTTWRNGARSPSPTPASWGSWRSTKGSCWPGEWKEWSWLSMLRCSTSVVGSILLVRACITALCKLRILGEVALCFQGSVSWAWEKGWNKEAVWLLGCLDFGKQHPMKCYLSAAFRAMQAPAEINDVPVSCNITWQGTRFVSSQFPVECAPPQQLVWFYFRSLW